MDIDTFLARRNASVTDVVEAVREHIGLSADDVLLAVGSLAEGIGNSKSDLDLILVTRRSESRLPPDRAVTLLARACVLDLLVLPRVELEQLLNKLRDWTAKPWSASHRAGFMQEERTLLHRLWSARLLSGVPGAAPAAQLQQRDLARLKLHVARHAARTIQVDLAGHCDSGDWRSLVFGAQELLGHATDALTAGFLLVNPLPKWRSKMVDSLPHDWASSFASYPPSLTAWESLWALHRVPPQPSPHAARQHALRAVAYSRAVFAWAERRLVLERKFPLMPLGPHANAADGPDVLPCLDLDVDFHQDGASVVLARLNGFSRSVAIPDRLLGLALQLDGRTPAAAAAKVYAPEEIAALLNQVGEAGLAAEPVPAGLQYAD